MSLDSTAIDAFLQMFRITIRATDETVPAILLSQMADRLAEGHQSSRQ